MALPEFTEDGNLPPGVHCASLSEVLDRFGGGSVQRSAVGDRLRRVCELANSTGEVARIVVYGSFVTDEPEPNDVDVFLLMEDTFDLNQVETEAALVFGHLEAEAHFGASVFWTRRCGAIGGEQAVIDVWQTRRDGGKRGIVEIVPEDL